MDNKIDKKENTNLDDKILLLEEKHLVRGLIYKITNTEKNISYVGQTVTHRKNKGKYRPFGIIGRLNDHISEAINNTKKNQCTYLNNAIRKYGSDKFKVELICSCSIDELNELEQKHIDLNKTIYPHGYNLTKGGKTMAIDNDCHKPELNEVSKRGREFGYKHKSSTIEKIKERINDEKNIERAKNTMKETMGKYYDEKKIDRLSKMDLDFDNLEKYIKPVYKKDTDIMYDYLIRINRSIKLQVNTEGQTLEEKKNRLLEVLKKAKERKDKVKDVEIVKEKIKNKTNEKVDKLVEKIDSKANGKSAAKLLNPKSKK